MNVETAISFIASYFYSLFVLKIKENKLELTEISRIRYVDWSLTTPFMILSLGLVLAYNNKTPFSFNHFVIFLLLNWGMLYSGYAGETKKLDKRKSQAIGFICFFILFFSIYILYVHNNPTASNIIPFALYFVIWTMYGVAYELKEEAKNTMYNILDLLSKCFVGLGFWAYLVGLFK
jgi:bacteriorhodopsin